MALEFTFFSKNYFLALGSGHFDEDLKDYMQERSMFIFMLKMQNDCQMDWELAKYTGMRLEKRTHKK
jgi:hypothetical protein